MQTINLVCIIFVGLVSSCSFVEGGKPRVKRGIHLIEDVGRLVSGLYDELQKNTDQLKAEFKKEIASLSTRLEDGLKEARIRDSSRELINHKLYEIKASTFSLSNQLDGSTQELRGTLGSLYIKHDEFQRNLTSHVVSVSARYDILDRNKLIAPEGKADLIAENLLGLKAESTQQYQNILEAFSLGLDGLKASILSSLDGKAQEIKGTLDSMDIIKYVELQNNITTYLAQQMESFASTVRNDSTIQRHDLLQCVNETVITTRRISELPHDKEWIVIQKRGTPLKPGKTRQDFNRPWIEYAEGFGDYDADFWIGLDKMHQLTSAGYTQLRFDLEDWEGNAAYAQYSVFRISSATDKYRITLGGYNGNAGDSLDYNNQKQFSTADRDNDGHSSGNCAKEYGPWWHPSCGSVFLNNIYHNQSKVPAWKGIIWYGWKGEEYSLKKTLMKIRRPTNETLIADECSTI